MSNPDLTGNLKPLPDALRALPQVAPERSVWPQLAAQLGAAASDSAPVVPLRARASRRRWIIPAAAAAGLALAALGVYVAQRQHAAAAALATVVPAPASNVANATNNQKATNAHSVADAGTQLAALQDRSQALERWLHQTADAAGPLPGYDLAAAAEIEDMIGLVDLQLSAAPRAGGLPLWQRRVALLEDLTALRYSSYSVAESGVGAGRLPAAGTN